METKQDNRHREGERYGRANARARDSHENAKCGVDRSVMSLVAGAVFVSCKLQDKTLPGLLNDRWLQCGDDCLDSEVSMEPRRERMTRNEQLGGADPGAYLVEYILQALLGERRALDVLHSTQFPCKSLALLRGDGPLLLPLQLLQDLGVVSQVDLRADDQARHSGTVVVNFREPFLFYVFE